MPTSGRLSAARDAFSALLWPIPVVAVLLSIALGIGLPHLDAHVATDSSSAHTLLFSGGAASARSVLSTIANSLITVTSLTFSLTVVTLQLASSQYSPRLLRTFAHDRIVQSTLALFLSTFTFALTVLRSVRSNVAGPQQAVPQISVVVAYLLTAGSVVALVGFLSHLTRQIRLESMVRAVHDDGSATLNRMRSSAPQQQAQGALEPPADAALICASRSGFLVGADEQQMLRSALDANAQIVLDAVPGDFTVAGVPIARVWPGEGGLKVPVPDIASRIQAALIVGDERTAAQDIGFSFRQLTDVAVKALSPGINDPTSAVHALDRSAALLCEFAGHELGPQLLHDEAGKVRVMLQRAGFADLLELIITQPLHYGGSDVVVLKRLLNLLREVAWCAKTPAAREQIGQQLSRLSSASEAHCFNSSERDALARLTRGVQAALAGHWEPTAIRVI